MKTILSTLVIGFMLVGCSSHVESSIQENPSIAPNEPSPCPETGKIEYNPYTGELKDVPCTPSAAVAGEETPPDEPPPESDTTPTN